jgi:hypothetical protein
MTYYGITYIMYSFQVKNKLLVTAKSDQDPDLHCLDPWIRIRIEVKIWVQIHNTGRVQQVLERYKFLSVVSYAGRSVAVPGSLNLGS